MNRYPRSVMNDQIDKTPQPTVVNLMYRLRPHERFSTPKNNTIENQYRRDT